ncbi:MAG: hypothetical protein K8S87_01010, partial [Planctomycetes bacterium]|nr:hypothetical protein [Planctomycetota bacterium]
MFRNLFVSLLFVAMLFLSGFISAQENPVKPEPLKPAEPEKPAEPDKTTENKKKYDINLVFTKDMKFSEETKSIIEMEVKTQEETFNQKIIVEIKMDYEILNIDKNQ